MAPSSYIVRQTGNLLDGFFSLNRPDCRRPAEPASMVAVAAAQLCVSRTWRGLALGLALSGWSAGLGCGSASVATGKPAGLPRPLPNRMELRLDSLQVVKDGDRIVQSELRLMVSSLPRPRGVPREPTVAGERPLAPDLFEALWARLSAFDFAPYQTLGPGDFEDLPGPTDTAYSNALRLSVDGVEVVNLPLPMGPLKKPVLRDRLDRLRADLDRLLAKPAPAAAP
jgi:hypothetical protein